ncbi:hypothetical protein HMPREF1155_0640 [Slackia sp. CM382]|nr:hypothetical protein HMPREF1155_0640 [Slackia sp. CM382]
MLPKGSGTQGGCASVHGNRMRGNSALSGVAGLAYPAMRADFSKKGEHHGSFTS